MYAIIRHQRRHRVRRGSSFGNFLGHLPAAIAAREEIMRELEQYHTPEGIRRDGARIIAVALKP